MITYHPFLSSVSIAMKFLEAQSDPITSCTKLWRDLLTNFGTHLSFDDATISELERGLTLGQLLELPPHLSFNYQHLSELSVVDKKLRKFIHLS